MARKRGALFELYLDKRKFMVIRIAHIVLHTGQFEIGAKCVTGHSRNNRETAAGGTPAVGAWISRLSEPAGSAVPSHLSLMYPWPVSML